MTDDLYELQVQLEEETRGQSVLRFHKEHLKGQEDGSYSETFIGSSLVKRYMTPFAECISAWVLEASKGRAGKRNTAAAKLSSIDAETAAYLMLKAIFNRVPIAKATKPTTLTALAIFGAGLIHSELRLREFDKEYRSWSRKIHGDFNGRELPRYKREEYMQQVFAKHEMEWELWTKSEMVHVGIALLDRFRECSGDIVFKNIRDASGRTIKIVEPSDGLLHAIETNSERCADLFTLYLPMVVPPVEWDAETLGTGGYISHNITPYPLVKASKPKYRGFLKSCAESGGLDVVLAGVNALQNTAWQVDVRVLDVIEEVYRRNITCGKLPKADATPIPPWPEHLVDIPETDEVRLTEAKKHKTELFMLHEHNRRVIGKRMVAQRAFQLARKYSEFDAIFFPHDLDSRGRAYPKPAILNPQGPDYVKGLLHFADSKPLTVSGVRWMAIHGANCWGEDKLPLPEREAWGRGAVDIARAVSSDPLGNLEWTRADNPVQFLAWCFAWAEAHEGNPEEYECKLHVDVDATCSGLQHFSAMLRDEVGGKFVNMTPSDKREDVYGAVAEIAQVLVEEDLDGDQHDLAKAWLDFGITRKITKRPVMVKPYAGTRQSCTQYVSDSVKELLDDGHPMVWPEDDLWTFQLYGASKVWSAIPQVVVAADQAMQWLSKVARLVGKSQPEEKRIEWVTPTGFPVHQYKFDLEKFRVKTFFDGSIIRASLTKDTINLNPRSMASSVAPSFVHSLDASHLQLTVKRAEEQGMYHFAAVHDSFGVHACDVDKFSHIIRQAFVDIYENHDVLAEFLETTLPFVSEKLKEEIPPLPSKGTLDLKGILENDFFFS